jgi:hypothetical protein
MEVFYCIFLFYVLWAISLVLNLETGANITAPCSIIQEETSDHALSRDSPFFVILYCHAV